MDGNPGKQTNPTLRILLIPVALLIWTADKVVSIAIGFGLVGLVWLVASLFTELTFGASWRVAGLVLGFMIIGFWEGCELPLNWLIDLLPGYRK